MKYFNLSVLFFLTSFQLQAENFFVDSQDDFEDAMNDAQAGDTIFWENGIYDDIYLDVDEDDVVISATQLGQTVFTGESYVEISGDDLVFRGFQFLDGNIGDEDVIDVTGDNVIITQVNIRAYTSYKYLRVREASQYCTILYCNFENRLNADDQNILSILVNDNQPGYHKVQWCSFKNFEGPGGDFGIEPIRIGVSTQADRNSRSLVEFCYFTGCDGDDEMISSKASQNVYRFNTFENNPKAELVLRHGSEGVVYGNFFLNNKGGVRIREGQHHYIYNNYFYDLDDRPLYIQNEDSDPLIDINIAFNTFIDCAEIRLGGSGFFDPTQVTFANNIFANPDDDLFEDPTNQENWIGNIAFGDLGIALPDGITFINPVLSENDEGYFETTSLSPAIDAAQPGYKTLPVFEGMDVVDSEVLFDIMMEARPEEIELKDVGCSERPHEVPVKPFANEANTGPGYNTDMFVSVSDYKLNDVVAVELFPNPVNDQLKLNIELESKMDFDVVLMDVNGSVIKTIYSRDNAFGNIQLEEQLGELVSGSYIINLQGFQTGKRVLLKSVQFVKF
jgi:hypothetical protein